MAKALIIAEKPSLGRSIVSALQWWKNEKFERQGKDRNTWLESDNYIVASSVGHLYELIDLDAYFPDYDPQNMLGVAGGGGGNQHGAADSTSGSLRNGVVPVNGGNGGGNGTFAVGSSGGMFDSFRAGISGNSSENNCEAPSGGGGGWQGGSANTGSKIWWGDGWAYCKRDGNGGSNYITSVNRTFTGANGKSVTVLEAYSDVGGGATSSGGNFRSYQDGFRPGNGYADQIKESVSDFLIFQAVAEEQKIKVTDDDVSNYFGGDALSVKQAKAYYGEAYLNQNVLYEKVYTWLVDHASIV